MGYSHDDWLRDQGQLPGINLDKIRFGHRVERRPKLAISFMGVPLPGEGKLAPKPRRERREEGSGYEQFQMRLW